MDSQQSKCQVATRVKSTDSILAVYQRQLGNHVHVCVPWSNHIGSIASGHPSYHGNPYSGYPCQSIAKRINHALTMAAVITVRAFLPGFPNFYSMREYRPEVPVREMSSAGHP